MKHFYSFKKIHLFVVAFMLMLSANAQTITISPNEITLDPDGTIAVSAVVTDTSGTPIEDAKINWSTDPGYLGKVDKNGVLTANHSGVGFLIAKYRELSDSVSFTVTGTPKNDDDDDEGETEEEREYPKIKIVPDNIRVEIMDSVELRAFYIDSTGTKIDTTFTWSVIPAELGSFSDSTGNIFYSTEETGKGTLVATLGELRDEAKITVYETKAKREQIKEEKEHQNHKGKQLTIVPGDTVVYTGHPSIQYSAVLKNNGVKHENATFNWSVSDSTIAEIDEYGMLILTGETGMTLVSAEYENFEASVELLVVDSTVDLEVNTISIRRVLPNGNELKPKYFKEGESYKIGGLPYPLNILNAGMLHFPFGCVDEDIDIYMFIPEEYAELSEDSTEVEFTDEIITGVKFSVVPAGSDTIVEPYYFNIPVNLKLVYKQELLDSLGVDPQDLDVFFADNTGFVSTEGSIVSIDTAKNRIYASIEHFSTIVVKSAEVAATATEIESDWDNNFKVYPNPMSESTTIRFNLEKSAKVELKVYNMFGQVVKVLADGDLFEGEHQITWNGSNASGAKAPSGIYLCKFVKDGNTSNVQRIILNH